MGPTSLHLALSPRVCKCSVFHVRSSHAQAKAYRNLPVAKALVLPVIHVSYWGHIFSTVTPGLFMDRLYNIAQILTEQRKLTDEWLEDARLVQV